MRTHGQARQLLEQLVSGLIGNLLGQSDGGLLDVGLLVSIRQLQRRVQGNGPQLTALAVKVWAPEPNRPPNVSTEAITRSSSCQKCVGFSPLSLLTCEAGLCVLKNRECTPTYTDSTTFFRHCQSALGPNGVRGHITGSANSSWGEINALRRSDEPADVATGGASSRRPPPLDSGPRGLTSRSGSAGVFAHPVASSLGTLCPYGGARA